eukprot:jgi/Botrbrau1/20604/Bobra.113_1s0030.1
MVARCASPRSGIRPVTKFGACAAQEGLVGVSPKQAMIAPAQHRARDAPAPKQATEASAQLLEPAAPKHATGASAQREAGRKDAPKQGMGGASEAEAASDNAPNQAMKGSSAVDASGKGASYAGVPLEVLLQNGSGTAPRVGVQRDGTIVPQVDAEDDLLELEQGLRASAKSIPCRYLYDERGNDLYSQITQLEEYYPYRTEVAMLEAAAPAVVAHIPTGTPLVELGCGTASKTALLLRAMLDRDGPEAVRFVGIDVLPEEVLEEAKASLLAACPTLLPQNVSMISAEYKIGIRLAVQRHPGTALCFLWLGSSIGNLSPEESLDFLRGMVTAGDPVPSCSCAWTCGRTRKCCIGLTATPKG